MSITNEDIARILGRIEGTLEAQGADFKQGLSDLKNGMASLEEKQSKRLDDHDARLRELEISNPKLTAETVADHAKRLANLEKGAAKAGMIGGMASGVGVAVLVELVKKKLGF